MMLLDINGWGVFSNNTELAQITLLLLKLLGGTVLVFLFSLASLLFIGLNTIRQILFQKSLALAGRSLIRRVALLGGAIAALSFALLASLVFQLHFATIFIASIVILFATQYLFRKAIFFLLLKRFGRYFLYLRSLRLIAQKLAYVFNR